MRSSRQICFRVNASPEIGLGHLMRCISLAHMLKDAFNICFFLRRQEASFLKLLAEHNLQGVEIEEKDFVSAINEDDIVVLDGYDFDTQYQLEIKKKNASLVCIDDLHDRIFAADLIINHAPGVTPDMYQTINEGVKFLLGSDFALLRPAFLVKNNKIGDPSREPKKVLICFGGSDFKNLSQSVLGWCQFDSEVLFTVITGSAYPYEKKLKQFIAQQGRKVRHLSSIGEREMREELVNTELAIVPSSGILFEAISCGVPVISGFYTQNQFDIYQGFLSLQVIYGAGDFSESSFKSTISLLTQKQSARMVENQKVCIDGKSPQRILNAFERL